jgi:hypothetical protein
MKPLRCAGLIAGLFLASLPSGAQFTAPYVGIQGALSTSSGTPAANATLTFGLSQVGFVSGTSVVVQEGQCATDVNGSVVGVGNPLTGARVTPQFTGTLPAGNYYVQFTWYDQFGNQTLPSPEVAVQLTLTGELQILPPVGTGPPQAIGMDVYIGATPGSEQYQGQTVTRTAQYTQAVPLITGAAVPTQNLTPCRVVANDAIFPTGTGYNVSLLDASGNNLFPSAQMWQFFGPGSTYNLSNGIPYYHGQVTYPIPLLTIPYNHNAQSISGPLSLTGYNLYNVGAVGVGTATPAWGVDVEGSGLDSIINANGGYLVNGSAGALGTCLGSDGTYYDTPIACSTAFYQTIQFNGVPLAQQPVLNFVSPLTATAGGGKTNVGAATTGTESLLVTSAAAGAVNTYAVWDAYGGITGSSAPVTPRTCNSNGCYRVNPDGTYEEWGLSTGCGTGSNNDCTVTVTLPHAFPTSLDSVTSTPRSNNTAANEGNILTMIYSPSASSFNVRFGATVQVGGGGNAIDPSVVAYWIAFGH